MTQVAQEIERFEIESRIKTNQCARKKSRVAYLMELVRSMAFHLQVKFT